MDMTLVKGMKSEIYVPITPNPVWAPVTKELSEMTIALVTCAGGYNLKSDKRFNLAGDTSYRVVPGDVDSKD